MLINQLFNILTEQEEVGRRAEFKYIEKKVKDRLDKVTLVLSGSHSATATRLARRYDRLDKTAKMLKEKRDELNMKVKGLGDSLFDAEDELVTRIIDTVSYTITLSAAERAEHKQPTKKVDFEAAFKALSELVPELQQKAEEILNQYTAMVPPTDTPTRLRVKPKTEVSEGIMSTLKSAISSFISKIKSWGKSYDKKLDDIKEKFPV
jgi:hypothetical protein